jgi:hypothetical protein
MSNFYEKEFEIRKNSPLWWHNKASDLFASAGALHATMNGKKGRIGSELGFNSGFSMNVACNPVYEMLFGMSFEALLKSICVAKGKPAPQTHVLVNLANTAEVNLTAKEISIFEYLTECIVWNGRYPIPKSHNFLEKHWKQGSDLLFDLLPSEGMVQFKISNDTLSWENLAAIWRKLSHEFFEVCT